jgi:hypothetical protein
MPQQTNGKVRNAGYDISYRAATATERRWCGGGGRPYNGHATPLLDAKWTLLAGAGDWLAATRREVVAVPAGDPADAAKRVAALRGAVAILALRIGDAIAATPPGR